jgi:spore coat polysaccharide biosynthesis protein SpsF
MNIGAIIQARCSSSRLPDKVLKSLPEGTAVSVLQHCIRRLQESTRLNQIIVATSTELSDNPIESIANYEQVPFYRGNLHNVLDRFYQAAKAHQLDIIVRITADCPCIDPKIVDFALSEHIRLGADYSASGGSGLPRGTDTEVISFHALEEAWQKATIAYEREHVTPYIYKTAPENFKIHRLEVPQNLQMPDLRITLDTTEDYALLNSIFDALYPLNPNFSLEDILTLVRQKPWLKLINEKVEQKKIFDTLEEELSEALMLLKKQDLHKAAAFLEKNSGR